MSARPAAAPHAAPTSFVETFFGRSGVTWAAAALVVLLLVPVAMGRDSYALNLLFSVFVFATLGHAWNLMAGYAGLLSFGMQVFVGIGAFAQAIVFYYGGTSIWAAWPVAGIASLAFAWLLCLPLRERGAGRRARIGVAVAVVLWLLYEWLIVVAPQTDVFGSAYVRRVALLLLIFLGALPLLRLTGAYFAVATWLVAEAVATVFNEWRVVGAGGGMQLKSEVTAVQLYYVALALAAVTTAVIWRWMRSSYGLALTAVRDDEEAARSSGIDVNRVKAAVFLFAATVTGLAAGLFYMDVVIVTPPSAFAISWASAMVFIAVAGGMGTVAGPVIGAVIYIVVDRVLSAAVGQGLLVLGVLSIALMLLLPRGVMGVVHDLRTPRRARPGPSGWTRVRTLLVGDSGRADARAATDQPGVVGAYLVSGSPLLALAREAPQQQPLLDAYARVAREIELLEPDTIVVYSTRWFAVLDQLWQGRARVTGLHVDENWHELGELRYDMITDVSLARACVRAAGRAGVASKLVDYAGFPIDSGTLVAQTLANPDGRFPTLVVANNLYHDAARTRALGEIVAAQANAQGKRIVVLAVGELSGSTYRDARDLSTDAIASATDDDWNRRVLALIEARDLDELQRVWPDYVAQAKVDMGFKHFAFALGALGGRLGDVKVHGYGAQYGGGAAVVRLF